MNLTCSKCGKREAPIATYCRDCYTVFPFEARAAALRGRDRKSSLGSWKWLPVIALLGGGIILFQADFGSSAPAEQVRQKASRSGDVRRPPRGFAPKGDDGSWSRLRDFAAERGGRAGNPQPLRIDAGATARRFAVAQSITATREHVGWVLGSDSLLDCPSIKPCPAAITFGSGDHGFYAVERWHGTSNTIIPVDREASHLLSLNRRALMKMELPEGRIRAIPLEKTSSRWTFHAGNEP